MSIKKVIKKQKKVVKKLVRKMRNRQAKKGEAFVDRILKDD